MLEVSQASGIGVAYTDKFLDINKVEHCFP